MDERMITGTGVKTKFVRVLTESTAVINFSLIKDHSIMGYTGMLKNMTHGCQTLPHYYHQHHGAPQIAMLYAQDVIKSRVRLCITDGFKLMFNGGPKWTEPRFVVPHESVYVTTDAVAMDTLGAELVDKARASDKGAPDARRRGEAARLHQGRRRSRARRGRSVGDPAERGQHSVASSAIRRERRRRRTRTGESEASL